MIRFTWNILLNLFQKQMRGQKQTLSSFPKFGFDENKSETCSAILDEIASFEASELRHDKHGQLAGQFNPANKPVTSVFVKKLKSHAASTNFKSLNISQAKIYAHCEEKIKSLPQSKAAELELVNFLPPPHIHMMGRKRGSMFDLKNCDIIINALNSSNKKIDKHLHYLDFGCSSGRTVRTLGTAFPDAFWHGADPVADSIFFARMAFPKHNFYISNQEPPLQFPNNTFDGVLALSIWSHFSAKKAKLWFEEMHRIIRPNGFFLLTAHGYTDIARKAQIQRFNDNEMDLIFRNIKESGFHFMPNIKQGHRELDTSDWGTTFFTKEWFVNNLSKNKWKLLHFAPGEWGGRQDVYVLSPKKRA